MRAAPSRTPGPIGVGVRDPTRRKHLVLVGGRRLRASAELRAIVQLGSRTTRARAELAALDVREALPETVDQTLRPSAADLGSQFADGARTLNVVTAWRAAFPDDRRFALRELRSLIGTILG